MPRTARTRSTFDTQLGSPVKTRSHHPGIGRASDSPPTAKSTPAVKRVLRPVWNSERACPVLREVFAERLFTIGASQPPSSGAVRRIESDTFVASARGV